ncbi:MAG: hypothetical protein KKF46_06750 [Nanoarchaeota archaeon]|nr:hypothetical protein [Nanoarchaeota archaeon]MBU1322028.1 hypothetical protein [Nanoarchaeota archaeon]MBU1597220.1 hypothetical protein [Nanoarchaeota archaeon]MBU2440735.1 hypothetical protein [Nanoarchaeota archaeon]
MAKDKAEYVPPKHITEYHKNMEKEKKLIDTADHHHRAAYETSIADVLTDKDGLINYDWLKKEERQLALKNSMSDFYLDRSLEHFGFKKPGEKLSDDKKLDVFKKERLMKAYANTTSQQIGDLIHHYQENFTYTNFFRHKDEMMDDLKKQLSAASMAHFTKDNIDDIIKHTGVGDMVEKKLLTVRDAVKLLRTHYENKGALPKTGLDKIISEYAVKEPFRSDYDVKPDPVKKKDDKDKK